MKHFILFLTFVLLLLWFGGCASNDTVQIAATTLPIYEFCQRLCVGTDLTVERLITENVSCLHDYTLQVRQMRTIESAQVIAINGAGLEDFLADLLNSSACIDASQGIISCEGNSHDHSAHEHAHGAHSHGEDPHIWLDPQNAKIMAENICKGLCNQFPEHSETFQNNLKALIADLDALINYGQQTLQNLSCRELITFHDGFSYFAKAFNLTILKAVEEESGSEASAAELTNLITMVKNHNLPAIFTEINGSDSAASIISRETGAKILTLDMAMAGDSYFDAMYYNIHTIQEGLQ